MTDLLLLSVPYTATRQAPAAPAILKSVATQHGFTVTFIDWNAEILAKGGKIEETFRDFAVSNVIKDKLCIYNETADLIERIKQINPQYIGISVFTYNSLPITKFLCLFLRQSLPNIKIILGGQGLSNSINHQDSWGFTAKELKLCDHWVKSEGEFALIEILKQQDPKDGNWQQIIELDELPFPDYSDYHWDMYEEYIPVTASRGCVRRCTFCDIHQHWKRFVHRDGEQVAKEVIQQTQKYGIKTIKFTDSLLNGNMKQYRKMIRALAEYNIKNPDQAVRWTSQFIFRPVNQMRDEDWRLTAASGAYNLAVGIESFSEDIRDHMQKHFSNEDIIANLHIMRKYKIQCQFLMIVGYVTETEEHIQQAKTMLDELANFNDVISVVQYGTTLSILPGTPLAENYSHFLQEDKHENNWVNPETGSTLKKRMEWLQELKAYTVEKGLRINQDSVRDSLLENFVKNVS